MRTIVIAEVSHMAARIGAPAMVDLQVTFDVANRPVDQGAVISRVYPQDAVDLFAGDQLVLDLSAAELDAVRLQAIPEPSSLALLAGVGLLGLLYRRACT